MHSFGNPFAGIFHAAVETPDNQYLLSVGNEINVIENIYGNATIYRYGIEMQKIPIGITHSK